MFRTVTIYRGEKMSVRQGWMVVTTEDGEQKLPIEDLYSVVIDNQQTALTTAAITQLTASGAHILICDAKHLPNIERLSRNLPPKGAVRVMQVTEKQYNAMQILVGERTATEDFLTPVDFTEI